MVQDCVQGGPSGPGAAPSIARGQGNEQLDLIPFEWEVLAAVDGQRDLHSLAEALGRSEFEVARTVYGLTNAGVVVLDDPTRPGEEIEPGRDLAAPVGSRTRGAGSGRYELAAGALEELLRLDPLMPEARRLLGLCYSSLGRFSAALDSWSAWSRLAPSHRARKRRFLVSSDSANRWTPS